MRLPLTCYPGEMVYLRLPELWARGQRAALALILEVKGSTPQVAGAAALITSNGLEMGTVGGGSFEAGVIKRSQELLSAKKSQLIAWSFAAEVEEEGSLCGGEALVLVDGFPEKSRLALEKMADAWEKRCRGVLMTGIMLLKGQEVRVDRVFLEETEALKGIMEEKIKEELREREPETHAPFLFALSTENISDLFLKETPLLTRKQGPQGKEGYLFVEPILPSPRLLVFGAGHVGRAVAQLGLFLGFEVFLFDDRGDSGLPASLTKNVHLVVADMAQSLDNFPVDEASYIIIVTRGHRQDAAVLRVALKKRAAYIGMIGSRRKVALMRQEFITRGWATKEEFDLVHAPIGLDIGAQTVEEIAVSIMAEVVAVRRQQRRRDR